MPTVLRILARMNVGGPARHVLRIAAPLRAAGWNSVLVTGQPEPGEGDLVELARSQGQEVVVVPALGRSVRPLADRRALAALRRLIVQWQPAVVHTHTAKAAIATRVFGKILLMIILRIIKHRRINYFCSDSALSTVGK